MGRAPSLLERIWLELKFWFVALTLSAILSFFGSWLFVLLALRWTMSLSWKQGSADEGLVVAVVIGTGLGLILGCTLGFWAAYRIEKLHSSSALRS